MRRFLVQVVLIVLSASAASGQDVVMVDDAERADWSAVGRINVGGYRSRSLCTGTLVAPDKVLTAAHCVVDPRTDAPFRAGRVIFVAGWHKGTYQGTSPAVSISVGPDYLDALKTGDVTAKLANDWAYVTLENPIDDVMPLAGAEGQAASQGPATLVGYRHDRSEALSRYNGCNITSVSAGVARLNCKVVQGTSGAPVLQPDANGDLRVVAVVSSRSTNGTLAALLP